MQASLSTVNHKLRSVKITASELADDALDTADDALNSADIALMAAQRAEGPTHSNNGFADRAGRSDYRAAGSAERALDILSCSILLNRKPFATKKSRHQNHGSGFCS